MSSYKLIYSIGLIMFLFGGLAGPTQPAPRDQSFCDGLNFAIEQSPQTFAGARTSEAGGDGGQTSASLGPGSHCAIQQQVWNEVNLYCRLENKDFREVVENIAKCLPEWERHPLGGPGSVVFSTATSETRVRVWTGSFAGGRVTIDISEQQP